MAINISTDIVVTTGGKLGTVTAIQGGWQSVSTYSTMAALTGSATLKGKLANGQIFYVIDENQLYQCTVAGVGPAAVYSFSSFDFPGGGGDVTALNEFTGSAQTSLTALNAATSSYALKTDVSGAFSSVSSSVSTRLTSLEAGGGSVPAGTVSSSTQIVELGFVQNSETSSFVVNSQTSSFAIKTDITGAFTSVSSSLQSRITTLEGASGGDVTALNLFTSSIQTEVNALKAATSSYALKTQISGAFSSDSSSISTRLTSLEAGGGSVPAGTISGSQQITDLGFINQSQTSSMSVATASYVSPTFISASAAASGFGTATLPSGVLSSSAQIAVEISGAFTSVSGGLAGRITTLEGTSGGDVTALNLFTSSIQTQVDNLTAETSSYLTSADTASFITISQTSSMSVLNAVTASYIDPTFISASAAAAGFGSGGGASISAGTVSSSTQILGYNIFATTGSNTFNGTEIVSGSLNVSGSLIANGLTYPTQDGVYENQVLTTNALGGLSFGDITTIYETIYNGEATTLVKGTPVYVSGSQGAAPKVFRADAGDPSKMPVVYVVSEDITTATDGRGIVLGLISGIDLTGYTAGQDVYVAVGGGWTSTRPTGSATIQFLGIITKAGAGGQGLILNPGATSLPNLTAGSVWVGNNNAMPTATSTASLNVLSAQTASYVSPTFISASAAASGFGSGGAASIPAGTVSSSDQTVANLVGQNVVVNTITAQQYVVSSSVSFITTSFSSGSTQFGDGLSDTHQFTGSVSITGSLNIGGPFTVNNENLNVSSGSIILTNSSSIVVLDSGIISGTFVGNLNYNYITNLPNLISSSAQIAALGAGLLSSSAQIASDISGAFTSVSSSFAGRITALEGASGGSGIFTLTGSFYSTTNNIQITGSLSVGSGSFKSFEVDSNGFTILGNMNKDLNTAPVGSIVYSGSSFYLIS